MLVAGRILQKFVDMFYKSLKCLISYPKHKVKVPHRFRKAVYSKAILFFYFIDCFEVLIQQFPLLQLLAITWLTYKNHNMVLVGKSPSDCFIFMPDAYGARLSNKRIARHIGFSDKLKPNEFVLADRGYSTADELALRETSLAILKFTFGKSPLPCNDYVLITMIMTMAVTV